MARSIEDLINNNSYNFLLKSVYTQSEHEKLIKKTINSLINKKEWQNTLLSLSVYPVQKWASECRKQINIDSLDLETITLNEEMFFGIKAYYNMSKHLSMLKITDEVMSVIEEGLNNNTLFNKKELSILNAAHNIDCPDTSKYLFTTNYENILIKYCEYYSNKINFILNKGTEISASLNDDEAYAFHNTDILIRMYTTIKTYYFKDKRDVDFDEVYLKLNDCFECLNSFPVNREDIYDVVKMVADEKYEVEIANSLGRSRTYIRSKYKRGVEAISFILWGYTAKDILQY